MNSTILAGTILYFAYGNYLQEQQIHPASPKAVFKEIARLEDYRIDFLGSSKNWNGSMETIVPLPGSDVWGAIWEIPVEELPNLDRQVGNNGNYEAFDVKVTTPSGEVLECRTYKQTRDPEEIVELDQLPDDRLPSEAYLNVIIEGAEEVKLPKEYIEFLKGIKFRPE